MPISQPEGSTNVDSCRRTLPINRGTEQFNVLHAAAFKLRGLLMVPLIALGLLCPKSAWELGPVLHTVGLLLFSVGLVVRCWAQRHFKYRLRSRGEHHLAVTGPFAYCRNPVYVGNLLLLTGVTTLCELIWAVPLVLLWGGSVYALAVRFEEFRLAKRFGNNYEDYCAAVPRWIPLMNASPRVACSTLFCPAGWGEVARAEWQCLALLLIPVLKDIVVTSPFYHSGIAWLVSFGG